jgi:hypothetical protein
MNVIIYTNVIYTNVIYTSIDISMLLFHIPNLLGAACGSDRHGVRGMMQNALQGHQEMYRSGALSTLINVSAVNQTVVCYWLASWSVDGCGPNCILGGKF